MRLFIQTGKDVLSWCKKNVPYPSGVGLREGVYIPQPEITITANNDAVRTKLTKTKHFADEVRWIVRAIAGILILYVVLAGESVIGPDILRGMGLISSLLLIISIFSLPIVVNVPSETLTLHEPEPSIYLHGPD